MPSPGAGSAVAGVKESSAAKRVLSGEGGEREHGEPGPSKHAVVRRCLVSLLLLLIVCAPVTWLLLDRSNSTPLPHAGSNRGTSTQETRPTQAPPTLSSPPGQQSAAASTATEGSTPPLWRQFLTSAGFGGTCAVLAAVLTFLYSRSKDRKQHWWDNLTWVYDRAVVEQEKREALPPQAATEALRALLESSTTRFGRARRRVLRYYGATPKQSPQEALISALYPAMSLPSETPTAKVAAVAAAAPGASRVEGKLPLPVPSAPHVRSRSTLIQYRQPDSGWSPDAELRSAAQLAKELGASGDVRSQATLAGVYERLALNALAGLTVAHPELEVWQERNAMFDGRIDLPAGTVLVEIKWTDRAFIDSQYHRAAGNLSRALLQGHGSAGLVVANRPLQPTIRARTSDLKIAYLELDDLEQDLEPLYDRLQALLPP